MNEEEYINTKTARKLLGVTTHTLRSWDEEGRISTIRTPHNQRLYNKKDIYDILGSDSYAKKKYQIVYCRVSSKKQENDLRRQVDFFKDRYPLHTIITDIGSGINWKKKGIKTILEETIKGNISEVVVAHRDRLCRFNFELIEAVFQICNVKLVVLDKQDGKSSNEDLADDILSIIHIYSCKEMGRRRYKNKEDKNISKGSIKDFSSMGKDNLLCL